VVAILLVGLFAGLSRAGDDSYLLRQMAPRPRSASIGLLVPTARPEPTLAPPTATALPTPAPATTAGPAPAQEPVPPLPPPPVGASAASPVPIATPTPTATPAPPTPAGSVATRAIAAVAPGSRFHEVEPGDTLFQIALANGTTVDAMMAANDIADRTEPLRVGRRLALPPP
jgi:LysM repeat protein